MKNAALIFLLMFTACLAVHAQQRVKERDLRGHWKMIIDVDEEYIEEELDDDDMPWIGRLFAKSITGLVFDILDEIDVEMHFMDHNRLKIVVEVFGEREIEYGHWYITRDGALVLNDLDDIDFGDDDDIWLMNKGRLVAYEQQGQRLERKPIYLRKLH